MLIGRPKRGNASPPRYLYLPIMRNMEKDVSRARRSQGH